MVSLLALCYDLYCRLHKIHADTRFWRKGIGGSGRVGFERKKNRGRGKGYSPNVLRCPLFGHSQPYPPSLARRLRLGRSGPARSPWSFWAVVEGVTLCYCMFVSMLAAGVGADMQRRTRCLQRRKRDARRCRIVDVLGQRGRPS